MIDPVILDFVAEQKRRTDTDGIAVVGSYPQGRYGPGSDIDIVCLVESDREVEARRLVYHETLFHLLTASAKRLEQFLVQQTEIPFAIGVVHSLAAETIILQESQALSQLIAKARDLVAARGIRYDPGDRDAIILHQRRYRVTKPGGVGSRSRLVRVSRLMRLSSPPSSSSNSRASLDSRRGVGLLSFIRRRRQCTAVFAYRRVTAAISSGGPLTNNARAASRALRPCRWA